MPKYDTANVLISTNLLEIQKITNQTNLSNDEYLDYLLMVDLEYT